MILNFFFFRSGPRFLQVYKSYRILTVLNQPLNVLMFKNIIYNTRKKACKKGSTLKPRTKSEPRAHLNAGLHTHTPLYNKSNVKGKEIQKRT